MIKLPTLYKSKNGKVQQWSVYTTVVDGIPTYIVNHGYVGGSIQETSTQVKQGKNVGHINETTAEEQCDLEAKALWTRQKDRKGYAGQITTQKVDIAPMLAHSYDDYPHKLSFPAYLQPKLDGIRCLAYMEAGEVKLLSRQRKEFKHLDHIREDLAKTFFSKCRNLILDGELYRHGTAFQSIISAVKRDVPSPETKHIHYNIYDNCDPKYGFFTRNEYLTKVWCSSCKYLPNQSLELVDTHWVTNKDEVDEWWKKYTNEGYEGVMLRNCKGLYVADKRSSDLLKYKKFKDAEFPIVGAYENKGKLQGTCVFEMVTKEGTPFRAMPEGSDDIRTQYWEDWKNGVIKKGMVGTVKFFSWSDSKPPVPRFPIFVSLRDYE
jgi:DNA ligase 1